jgi:hypothetical protein
MYMGDGVLVYFGYPQGHEDDAERAVRAGLRNRWASEPRVNGMPPTVWPFKSTNLGDDPSLGADKKGWRGLARHPHDRLHSGGDDGCR